MDHGTDRAEPRAEHRPVHRGDGPSSLRLLKAFTHPLRVAILARLDEAVLSPKELASELRSPLPVVSYHVRELERLKMIELVKTAQRRGAVQHWYRTKPEVSLARGDWEAASTRRRREIARVALARLEAAAAGASEEGGFDRVEVQLSREMLALDERGFTELARMLQDVRTRAAQVSQAAQDRLQRSGAHPVRATLSLMLFEGPYGTPPKAPRRRKPNTARVRPS